MELGLLATHCWCEWVLAECKTGRQTPADLIAALPLAELMLIEMLHRVVMIEMNLLEEDGSYEPLPTLSMSGFQQATPQNFRQLLEILESAVGHGSEQCGAVETPMTGGHVE